MDVGIFTTDTELVIRSWDDWLTAATGIPADVARGQLLAALAPGLTERGLLARFQRVLADGVVEILAPAFHRYLIRCEPRRPSPYFDVMQQYVTIVPLRDHDQILGTIVTITDVTEQRERERELAEQLESADEDTRLRAAQRLADDAATPADTLIGAIGDTSWRVRRAAVGGLAHKAGPETIATLVRALHQQHHDPSVLNSALQVLAVADEDALTPLVECLGAPDPDLRGYVALALGERGDPAAAPALLHALGDADLNVRYHAIEALGKVRATEAVDALAAVAETRDFFLAFPALDALAHIGDPSAAPRIVPLLQDELLRAPAAEALGKLGDATVVAPLAAALDTPGAPAQLIAPALAAVFDRYEAVYGEGAHIADLARSALTPLGWQQLLAALPETPGDDLRALVLVLGWIENPLVEQALARLLGQPQVRRAVLEALVRHGRRVAELLIEQLASDDLETRQAAATALGSIGDARAVPALARLLGEQQDLAIVAAGALAKIGDRRAFGPLLDLLGHPSAAVRQAAVGAINSLGHPDMAARAPELLRNPDPHVREAVVKIAGYFGFPSCVDALLACCRDADERVRRAAIEHLPYLEDPRVLPALAAAARDSAPGTRVAAARALAHVDRPAALPLLLAALDDADAWVRFYAARALGQHGAPAALARLGRAAQADPASQVRVAALEALGSVGGADAVAMLAPFAESDDLDLAQAAIGALGQILLPEAQAPLLAVLRSAQASRRSAAIAAIGARGGSEAIDMLQAVAAADAEPQVARAAICALGRIAGPQAIAAIVDLAADSAHRDACTAELARLDEQWIDSLARGLAHQRPGARCAVVDALARMKHPRASEYIRAALGDADPSVRLAAAVALGSLGSRAADRTLAQLAQSDPDAAVRRAARAALRE